MGQAKHPNHIARRIYDLLEADRVGSNALGIEDLFYGDQDKIVRTPTVTVEASDTSSPLSGAPNMVTRNHTCFVTIFHAGYESNETTKEEAEIYAADIADFLDSNLQLKDTNGENPIVIYGYVTANAPGYLRVGDNKFRASRLTWQGISKTQLGA